MFTGWQSTNQKEFTFDADLDLTTSIDTGSQATQQFSVRAAIRLALDLPRLGVGGARHSERGPRAPSPSALALSGAMYALGFVVIGIAHEYRYIYLDHAVRFGHDARDRRARVLPARRTACIPRSARSSLIAAVILFREVVVRFAL